MELAQLLEKKQQMESDIEIINLNIKEIDEAIDAIVGEPLKAARLVSGKDTGAVNLSFGAVTVTQTIPKKVEWDEGKLKELVYKINSAGDEATNYIEIKTVYNIPEKKYAAFPEPVKKVFDAARTVSPGKPKLTFKIGG